MRKTVPTRHLIRLYPVAVGLGALLLTGCAGMPGSVRPVGLAEKPSALTKYRYLLVELTKAESVDIVESELERIKNRIIEAIWVRASDRFKEINPTRTDPHVPVLLVTVRLTKYEKGSAVARAMLAGLGRIHISALVSLTDWNSRETLGEYEVSKTFAWGGIYGASRDVDDVEVGFAGGVATVLLGEQQ